MWPASLVCMHSKGVSSIHASLHAGKPWHVTEDDEGTSGLPSKSGHTSTRLMLFTASAHFRICCTQMFTEPPLCHVFLLRHV